MRRRIANCSPELEVLPASRPQRAGLCGRPLTVTGGSPHNKGPAGGNVGGARCRILTGAGVRLLGGRYFFFAVRPMNQPAASPAQHAPAMNLPGWLRT